MYIFCEKIADTTFFWYDEGQNSQKEILKGKRKKNMDLQYTATIYLTIFALIIMILIVRSNDLLEKDRQNRFIFTFLVIIVAALAEWMGNWINGAPPSMRFLHIIVRATEHTIAPVISMVLVGLIAGKEKANVLRIPLVIHGVLEFASGYLGFIYYVDAENIYHHGEFYGIYVAFYLVCSLYFIIEAWRFGQKYQSANRFILEMIMIFLVTGVAFRILTSTVRVDYICLTVDSIFVYIYYTEIIEKNDSVTGLLNRRSYEGYISNINKPLQILFFDVDNFKKINDIYGHAFGDECLKIIGTTISEVYAKSGHCYRIGGDEFCVLLDRCLDSVDELNAMFGRQMKQKKQKESRLPYVSVGQTFFDPAKEDMETAIHAADIRMYQNKQRKKQERDKLL